MAYGIMDQFKAQRGFITYDFETLSDQVMINVTDQTTLLSQLSKLSNASTEVFPNRDQSYELVKRCQTLFDELSQNYQDRLEKYELPNSSFFVHLQLAQTFESIEQMYQSMKYDDENIPFDRCVKVLGWNSSRFDIALLWDALDCELWTMDIPIGDLNNTQSITVTNKKSRMKLQFIDAENLFVPMTLNAFVKDYSDKSEHKDVFSYEIIKLKNWNEVLMKTEHFENEDSKSQLKGANENAATHVFALDGNIPYPCSYSSVKNKNIPITDCKISIEIQNKEEVIGEYMYSQAQKHSLPMTKKDRKLTTLLDTNGQFMIFNNYYLWLLIDLGFVITDYKAIAVFEKNAAYEPFVRTMMNLRIQAILAGSTKEKFYKLIINSSYGYDTLNTEKFGKIKMLDKAGTF
ncbi:MAG: hypothetical protein EZS28_019105, partial [Streblomastix strix]